MVSTMQGLLSVLGCQRADQSSCSILGRGDPHRIPAPSTVSRARHSGFGTVSGFPNIADGVVLWWFGFGGFMLQSCGAYSLFLVSLTAVRRQSTSIVGPAGAGGTICQPCLDIRRCQVLASSSSPLVFSVWVGVFSQVRTY